MTRHSATSNGHSQSAAPSAAEYAAAPAPKCVGACDPAERFDVVLILRRQNAPEFDTLVRQLTSGDPAAKPLTRAEYDRRFGASAADFASVKQFAAAHGFTVVSTDPLTRQVVLSGTVAQYQAAFGVSMESYEHTVGARQFRYRKPAAPVVVPPEVRDAVSAVLGFDNHAKAQPYFRVAGPVVQWRAAHPSAQAFTPLQIAESYGFPAGDGGGECIALIELGGGYRDADLKKYFAGLGVKPPQVDAVSVDGAANTPTGDPNGPDGEVALDIEIVGALAPGARIGVYFAPNTEAGFANAISAALHDTVRQPSVISISWGGPETAWSQQALTALNSALQAAVVLGVTVCAASGDNGSSDGVAGSGDYVDFPASSPYALGCGGTRVVASGGRIKSETVWGGTPGNGATGGGISTNFALPAWQRGLSAARSKGTATALTKRGVPDVAGNADPSSGYTVLIDGTETVVGGTSAVAPLWAALLARINAARGKPVGLVNALLYKQPAAFHDITQGSNGDFAASQGWDACTGLGSPIGSKIAAALGAAGPAK